MPYNSSSCNLLGSYREDPGWMPEQSILGLVKDETSGVEVLFRAFVFPFVNCHDVSIAPSFVCRRKIDKRQNIRIT